MNIGVSPLTYTIYAGKSKPLKNGKGFQWVGKKTDVTDEAINAVFEYMYLKAKETGYYEITIEGFGSMKFDREATHEASEDYGGGAE